MPFEDPHNFDAEVFASKRARILFIDHTATLGGGEIALLNLVRHLDQKRFDPVVVLFENGPLIERLSPQMETHILPMQQHLAKTRKDSLGIKSLAQLKDIIHLLLFTWQVAKFVRGQNADLVYANSLKADIIGGLAGRLTRRPVVWHVRDRISEDYLPKSVAFIFKILAKVIPSHLIANSAATMKTVEFSVSSCRTSDSHSTVVHDGTSLRLWDTRAAPGRSATRVGLIGRISPWKGQHVFLQAAAQVHRHHPDVRFLLIGAALFGEEEYERKIRALAIELGLSDAVEFAGFRVDIHEHIAQLDIVVHASTTGEPFGQVIIEAMAASKPVVATNGGGVPEVVLDGQTGLLVPMGDPAAMANAIRWMIDNPNSAAEMGCNGRRRVEENFTIEKTVTRVEAVLSGLLQKAAPIRVSD